MQLACVLYVKHGQVCYSEVSVHGFSSKSLLKVPLRVNLSINVCVIEFAIESGTTMFLGAICWA